MVGGGGRAPGDMVSGMRPPLPIEPGAYCASAGVATVMIARAMTRSERMIRIWSVRRHPQVYTLV